MRSRLELVEGGAQAPRWPLALELGALAAGLTLCFTLAGSLHSWAVELGRFQALMGVAFLFLALTLARSSRYRSLPHTGLFVVVVAFALRVSVLMTPPTLSDDIYRYVWEGRVIAAGQSPYAFAPSSPELAPLRDAAIHPRVNHPELRTIYPPLAQAGFALVATLSPTVLAMKLWILLHDLALVCVLVRWCQKRSGSALAAVAYAWNPLIVAEYAGSGHHDPTALLWLILAFYWNERRPLASAFALSAAVMVKLLPIVALPFLWRRWSSRARVAAVTVSGAGLAVFAWLTQGDASGLGAYAAQWRNNELVFHYLALALGDQSARWVVAGVCAIFLIWRLRLRVESVDGARDTLRFALLVGPVLHPWYLGWAMVFEPLRGSAPWLLLSALSLLSYGVLSPPPEGGAHHLALGWRWVEYGLPMILAGILAWLRHTRRNPDGL